MWKSLPTCGAISILLSGMALPSLEAGNDWFGWFLPRGLDFSVQGHSQPLILSQTDPLSRYVRTYFDYRHWMSVRYKEDETQFGESTYGIEFAQPLSHANKSWGAVSGRWSGFTSHTSGRFGAEKNVRYRNNNNQIGLLYSHRFLNLFEGGAGVCIGQSQGRNTTGFAGRVGFHGYDSRVGMVYNRQSFKDLARIVYGDNRVSAPLAYRVDQWGFHVFSSRVPGLKVSLTGLYSDVKSDLSYDRRFSSLPDGQADRYEASFSYTYRRWQADIGFYALTFSGLSRFEKDDQRYAKVNFPNPGHFRQELFVRYQAGQSTVPSVSFERSELRSHVGVIMESWPFTGSLVNLLGTTYHASVDGHLWATGIYAGCQRALRDRHVFTAKGGWLSLKARGEYEYRKIADIFVVLDQGAGTWSFTRDLLHLSMSYRLNRPSYFVELIGEQLVPLPEKGNLSDNLKKLKIVGGGSLIKASMTIFI